MPLTVCLHYTEERFQNGSWNTTVSSYTTIKNASSDYQSAFDTVLITSQLFLKMFTHLTITVLEPFFQPVVQTCRGSTIYYMVSYRCFIWGRAQEVTEDCVKANYH